jgi:hypothetical protein
MDDGKQVDALAKELEQDEGTFRAMRIALHHFKVGYRLDYYPNGKSKDELIANIEAVEAERDKARNLLRAEHSHHVYTIYIGEVDNSDEAMSMHKKRKPQCSICAFIAETSLVKP